MGDQKKPSFQEVSADAGISDCDKGKELRWAVDACDAMLRQGLKPDIVSMYFVSRFVEMLTYAHGTLLFRLCLLPKQSWTISQEGHDWVIE